MKLEIIHKRFVNKEYEHCLIGQPFRIFYNLDKSEKSPKDLTSKKIKEVPDYILRIFKSLYETFGIYTKKCKFSNPLKEGVFFQKGAKFIDIYITCIPKEKGQVSLNLINNGDYFLDSSKMQGSSISICLDNDLITNTTVPTNKLFQVFLCNYGLDNVWLIGGLTKWAQNLTYETKNINYKYTLPRNLDELNILFSKPNQSEYFWIELTRQCDKYTIFVREFLENYRLEVKKLEDESQVNNKFISKILIETIETLVKEKNKILKDFIEILKQV